MREGWKKSPIVDLVKRERDRQDPLPRSKLSFSVGITIQSCFGVIATRKEVFVGDGYYSLTIAPILKDIMPASDSHTNFFFNAFVVRVESAKRTTVHL